MRPTLFKLLFVSLLFTIQAAAQPVYNVYVGSGSGNTVAVDTSRGNTVFLDVTKYGVVCDSTVDNTAAIEALLAAGKRKLYFPGDGTNKYGIQSAYLRGNSYKPKGLQLRNGTQILGDGIGKTIFKKLNDPAGITDGAPNAIGNVSGDTSLAYWWPIINGISYPASNCVIEGIEIDGNMANSRNWTGNAYYNNAFYLLPVYSNDTSRVKCKETAGMIFYGSTNNTVRNCRIYNTEGYGIDFTNSKNGYVENCYAYSNGNGGFGTHWGSNNCTFRNVHTDSTWSDGIRIENSLYNKVLNSEFTNARDNPSGLDFAGIYFEDASNCLVEGNTCTGNSSCGIDLGSQNSSHSNNNIIRGNFIYKNVQAGMYIPGSTTVDGNLISSNGNTPGSPAIILAQDVPATNFVIINNTVKDVLSGYQTIFIKYAFTSSVVKGNVVNNITDDLMAYSMGSNVQAEGNVRGVTYWPIPTTSSAGGIAYDSVAAFSSIAGTDPKIYKVTDSAKFYLWNGGKAYALSTGPGLNIPVVGSANVDLTISTSTATVTESPSHTFSSASAVNYVLFNQTIPSGSDFLLEYQMTGTNGSTSVQTTLGLDTDVTLEWRANWPVYVYTNNAAAVFACAFSSETSAGSPTTDMRFGIRRVGTVHTLEYNVGSGWVVINTYSTTYTGAYYIKAILYEIGNLLKNPRLTIF